MQKLISTPLDPSNSRNYQGCQEPGIQYCESPGASWLLHSLGGAGRSQRFFADAINRIKQRVTLAVPGRWKRERVGPAESHALHEDCEESCWLVEEDPKHQEVRQAETLRPTSVHAAQALGVGVCAHEAWLHLVQKARNTALTIV